MTGDVPPQLHFDPMSGTVPDEVGPGAFLRGAGGGVVTLFLAEGVDREWAGRTAIELSRTWGDSGHRVFLGDLCFHLPVLHDILEEPASPNLADVILRQVRIEDVVRPVVAGSFLFAPACPADAEAAQMVGDVGWDGLIAGFAEVGATVVFFADEHVPGLGRILESSNTVIVLSATGAGYLPPDVAARVRVVLQPPGDGATQRAPDPSVDEPALADTSAEPAPEESVPTRPDEPEDVQPIDVDPEPDRAARASWDEDTPELPPPGEESASREWEAYLEDDAADPVTEGVAHGGDKGSSPAGLARRTLPVLVGIILVLLVISIVWPGAEDAAPAGSSDAPPAARAVAETPASADPEPAFEEADVARTPPPDQPTVAEAVAPVAARVATNDDPPLGYSLALAAYRDPGAALGRAEALGRLLPGVAFIVAPIRVDGTTYHRLLAVAGDVDDARALRGRIGPVTPGDDSSAWIVRRTPLAFELAAASDMEEARALVDRAASQGINAYIVIQSGADRPIVLVLAGAYREVDEAAALGDLLAEAGFADARLKSRAGRIVR